MWDTLWNNVQAGTLPFYSGVIPTTFHGRLLSGKPLPFLATRCCCFGRQSARARSSQGPAAIGSRSRDRPAPPSEASPPSPWQPAPKAFGRGGLVQPPPPPPSQSPAFRAARPNVASASRVFGAGVQWEPRWGRRAPASECKQGKGGQASPRL